MRRQIKNALVESVTKALNHKTLNVLLYQISVFDFLESLTKMPSPPIVIPIIKPIAILFNAAPIATPSAVPTPI